MTEELGSHLAKEHVSSKSQFEIATLPHPRQQHHKRPQARTRYMVIPFASEPHFQQGLQLVDIFDMFFGYFGRYLEWSLFCTGSGRGCHSTNVLLMQKMASEMGYPFHNSGFFWPWCCHSTVWITPFFLLNFGSNKQCFSEIIPHGIWSLFLPLKIWFSSQVT